jgi:alpha-tubulin suppressor-like RCC1 family protein
MNAKSQLFVHRLSTSVLTVCMDIRGCVLVDGILTGSDSKGVEEGDDADEPSVFHPMLVTALETGVEQAAGGEDFILVLAEDGALWGW